MGKIIWLSTAVLSLIVSIVINFNAKSVTGFLIGSLILALIIFGILALIVKSIKNIKEKNTKKAILFGVLSVIAIVIFSFGYLMFTYGGMCLTAITPAHFRTNILTGQCNYGGGASCVSSDPWYYKPGCDSDAKKTKAIENTIYYDTRLQECKKFCDDNNQERFCDAIKRGTWGNGPADIDCNILTTCNSISCN